MFRVQLKSAVKAPILSHLALRMAPLTYPLRSLPDNAPQALSPPPHERDAPTPVPETGTSASGSRFSELLGPTAALSIGDGRWRDQHTLAQGPNYWAQFFPLAGIFPPQPSTAPWTAVPSVSYETTYPSSLPEYPLAGGGPPDPPVQSDPYSSFLFPSIQTPKQAQNEAIDFSTLPLPVQDDSRSPRSRMMLTFSLGRNDSGYHPFETKTGNFTFAQGTSPSDLPTESAFAPRIQPMPNVAPSDIVPGSPAQVYHHPADPQSAPAHPVTNHSIRAPHSTLHTLASRGSLKDESASSKLVIIPWSTQTQARRTPTDPSVLSPTLQGRDVATINSARRIIEKRYRRNLETGFDRLEAVIPAVRVLRQDLPQRPEDVVDARNCIDGVEVPKKLTRAIVLEKACEYICVKTHELTMLKRLLSEKAPEILAIHERDFKLELGRLDTVGEQHGSSPGDSDDGSEALNLMDIDLRPEKKLERVSHRRAYLNRKGKKRAGNQGRALPTSSRSC